MRIALLVPVCLVLAACGLGETASTAAVGGAAKVKEIEAAKQTQERVLQQVDQASQQARERLDRAESAAK